MRTFLLPVTADELMAIADGLISLPDDYHDAAAADAVHARTREMVELLHPPAREWLRAIGVGPAQGKPQG
jgi:hypothetical protein